MASKKRILFVCLGNICRSPVAEAVLKSRAQKLGMSELYEIDSAGTIDYHVGDNPDPRMREAAGRRGYALHHRARQIARKDLETFDLIVPMDQDNMANILELDPYDRYAAKVRLLCDFIPGSTGQDVPDPYYGGRQGFDRVIDLIEAASDNILQALLAENAEEREMAM